MINKEIPEKIEQIRLDRWRGASELAREALLVLKFAVEVSREERVEVFLEGINEVGRRLFMARPNMSPIQNLIARAVYEINKWWEESGRGREGIASLKEVASSKIEELLLKSELAVRKVSKHGASLIEDFDVIMTCSYSSTLCETFKAAKRDGKDFSLMVAESNVSGRSYGQLMAKKLEGHGIRVEVFPDSAINVYTKRSKKVFVGADSILFDGSLINGTPTYKIAQASKRLNLPLYVLCETAKFNVLSYLGERPEIEKGFDLVPPELITAIVTEQGVVKPSEVILIIKRMEAYVRFLRKLCSREKDPIEGEIR